MKKIVKYPHNLAHTIKEIRKWAEKGALNEPHYKLAMKNLSDEVMVISTIFE